MSDVERDDPVGARPPDAVLASGFTGAGQPVVASADEPVPLVPEWLSNVAALGWRVLIVAALVVVAAYVLTLLWTVTASIAVAVIVSAVFAPFVLRLRAGGRSRTASAAIVWATAILVIGGLLLLVVLALLPYLAELVSSHRRRADRGRDTAGRPRGPARGLGRHRVGCAGTCATRLARQAAGSWLRPRSS